MKDEHAAGYDFVQLGEGLAKTLLAAAEEQVAQAQTMLDQTKSLVEILRTQVAAQAEQIAAMNARFKAFGETMLDAHRKLNGAEKKESVEEKGRLLSLHEREETLRRGLLPRVNPT